MSVVKHADAHDTQNSLVTRCHASPNPEKIRRTSVPLVTNNMVI